MGQGELFKNINKEEVLTLLKCLGAREVNFKKGMTILSNLKNTNELGIILEGNAKLVQVDYNGNKTIIENYEKDDIFGSHFSKLINDGISVVSETEVKVLFIEYDKIIKRCNKNCPKHECLISNLVELLVKKINNYNIKIEILTQKTIRNKFLTYIHYLERIQNSSKIKLPFSYTALAEFLAVDRSAMMREIKNLKNELIIETNGKYITLIYN